MKIENQTTEFKREYNDKIKKTAVSFLNCNGGVIYVGIEDNGNIIGVADIDKTMNQITSSLRDGIEPDTTNFFDIECVEMDGKIVLQITIKKGNTKPYFLAEKGYSSSGVYIRVGAASVPASREQIRKMIKETDGDKFEEQLSKNQRLTLNYAESVFAEKDIIFHIEQQQSLGLITADNKFTNLGLLLADECPYTIKCAFFQGLGKEIFRDRREFDGSIFKQLNDTISYLDLLNKTAATIKGIERIDKRDYPEIAIREAILNALMHREYDITASIHINIYDDRLEIISVGGLLPDLTKNAILSGVSKLRNKNLAEIFLRLKFVEKFGTGMRKILNAYNGEILQPNIDPQDGVFVVTLPNLNYKETFNKSMHKKPVALKDNEKRVITKFKDRPFTRKEVLPLLKLKPNGVYKLLDRMVERGLLSVEKVNGEFVYQVL
jgi:ATP-dependent DNA helicase RecG